jgi:DNA-binding LytR/AlgR family response regulator
MIRCAICDNEYVSVKQITQKVECLLKDNRVVFDLRSYTSSRDLYFDIYDGISFDIVLLDIDMPDYNGIEIAKILKQKQPECLVIFLTSFRQYAVDAIELEIFRYIPKDELDVRFEKYLMEAVTQIRELDERAYVINKKGLVERIPYKNIRYLKKVGKYTSICCTNNIETKVRKPLNIVVEELDSPEFVIIDRGCAVNICYISKLYDNDVYLKNGERLPVSRSNMKSIHQIIIQYWGGVY